MIATAIAAVQRKARNCSRTSRPSLSHYKRNCAQCAMRCRKSMDPIQITPAQRRMKLLSTMKTIQRRRADILRSKAAEEEAGSRATATTTNLALHWQTKVTSSRVNTIGLLQLLINTTLGSQINTAKYLQTNLLYHLNLRRNNSLRR